MKPVSDQYLVQNLIVASEKMVKIQAEDDDRDNAVRCAYLSGISQLAELLVKHDGSDITAHRILKLLPEVGIRLGIPFGEPPTV